MMHKSVIFNKSLCIYGGVDSRDIQLTDMWILNLGIANSIFMLRKLRNL